MKNIIDQIQTLSLGSIDLLALVTDKSMDVVFYCTVDGKVHQSNNMIENGLIDSSKLSSFNESIVATLKKSKEYKSGKMNILKINRKNEISVTYEEPNCRVYGIKKEWKNSLVTK